MNKKTQFLMLVQTAAIVRDIHSAHGRQIAHAVLGSAMNIPEECIPGDNELVDAVGEYVSWQYGEVSGGEKAVRPQWLS